MRCPKCKGNGGFIGHVLEHNNWHECGRCNGTGKIRLEGERTEEAQQKIDILTGKRIAPEPEEE